MGDGERQRTLASMRPDERAALGDVFGGGIGELVVLSYTRRLMMVEAGPGGRQRPIELRADGAGKLAPSASGSAAKEDLYASFTVTRTRSSRPYEWRVWAYAEWRGGLRGMGPSNGSADTMAIAWAGGAYLQTQTARGARLSHWPCGDEELDEWPSDGSSNVGTAWSFHEFGAWGCPMRWALVELRIRQDALVGRTDNLVYRYFHTFGGLTYDIGFSRGPGISITPTNEQWSLALFGSYTH